MEDEYGNVIETDDAIKDSLSAKFDAQQGASSPSVPIGSIFGAGQSIYSAKQDIDGISNIDTNDYFQNINYSDEAMPQAYQEQAIPGEIAEGVGTDAAFKHGIDMAGKGAAIAGPWGAAAGLAVGIGVGISKGNIAKEKRELFAEKQQQKKVKYAEAMSAYSANQGKKERNNALQSSFNKRRENNIPLYNSSLYGNIG